MSYADSHDHYGYATTSDLDDLRRQLDALQASINGLEGAFQALEGEVRELTARPSPEGDQP